MTLKVDKAGRVILPKPIRDRLGLHAGSELEVEETPEGIMLRPADQRPSLIRKGGFWVHSGEISTGYEILKAIDQGEDERTRKAWGL